MNINDAGDSEPVKTFRLCKVSSDFVNPGLQNRIKLVV